MQTITSYARRALVAVAVTALAAACVDRAPTGPRTAAAARMDITSDAGRGVDLGGCEHLQVRVPSVVAMKVYAKGDQIYRWTGAAWVLHAPDAALYADAAFTGQVGTHYAGPRWKSNSGGEVKGSVVDRCTPDAGTIPWLLLAAEPESGSGVFQRANFIHRLNTAGGLAPSTPGGAVGELVRVPYTALYVFHRPE